MNTGPSASGLSVPSEGLEKRPKGESQLSPPVTEIYEDFPELWLCQQPLT